VTCVTGQTCTFDGTGSTDDVGVVAYEWRGPAGGLLSTLPVFTRHFDGLGDRTWSLTVRDEGGLSNSKTFTFTIVP